MSYSETEIKLPVRDLAAAHRMTRELGGKLEKARHLEDNFLFDDAAGTLRSSRKLLRVRQTSDTPALLTFKDVPQIEDGVRKRDEIECNVIEGPLLIAILKNLGFQTTFRYQKYRSVYQVEDVLEICVDETPIGNYFELEGPIEKIHEFALRLGYNRNQYITDSYVALYFKWCKLNQITPDQMIFPEKNR